MVQTTPCPTCSTNSPHRVATGSALIGIAAPFITSNQSKVRDSSFERHGRHRSPATIPTFWKLRTPNLWGMGYRQCERGPLDQECASSPLPRKDNDLDTRLGAVCAESVSPGEAHEQLAAQSSSALDGDLSFRFYIFGHGRNLWGGNSLCRGRASALI